MLANLKTAKTPAMAYKSPHPIINKDGRVRNSVQVKKARSTKNGVATERSIISSRNDSTERESSLQKKNGANFDKLKVKFIRKKHPELLQDKVSRDVNAQYGVNNTES